MKRLYTLLICLAALSSVCFAQPGFAEPATACVFSTYNGTGLVIGKRADTVFVITAGHVIRQAKAGAVQLAGRAEPLPATVLLNLYDATNLHNGLDLALLAVAGASDFYFTPVPVDDRFDVPAGCWHRSCAAGAPVWKPQPGVSQFIASYPDSATLHINTNAIEEGDSGGPVVTAMGVVGLCLDEGGHVLPLVMAWHAIRQRAPQAWQLSIPRPDIK